MPLDFMTTEQFCSKFDQLETDTGRIQFLNTLHAQGYPFHLEESPEVILSRFISIGSNPTPAQVIASKHYYMNGTNMLPATEVAKVFAKCFPAPCKCKKLSETYGGLLCIIDTFIDLSSQHTKPGDAHRINELKAALIAEGM
jgi:hypothetical protein